VQVTRVLLETPFGQAQELDIAYTEDGSSLSLLSLADARHLIPRERRVEPASVAAGQDAVRHLDTRIRPSRDGAPSPELRVIGVRNGYQNALEILAG
jgi:hypothetical protein